MAALMRVVEPTRRTGREQPRTRLSASSRATVPNSSGDGAASVVTSSSGVDVTTAVYERMFVAMGLRWEQGEGGYGDWQGLDDTGRMVASVVAGLEQRGGWTWRARWWGDRPPGGLGLSLGRDATIVAEGLDDAEGAMAAVDAHIAARGQDPPRQQ